MAKRKDTNAMNTKNLSIALMLLVIAFPVTVAATYANDSRGYTARACGFDMNRNGTIGEPADATVGDGNTTDPDGDSTDEDLIYVDATDGNDNTGDGSAGNPYKTVQYALNQADGPGDGAEDIVCISGVFQEEITLTQSGVAGYYTRDNFQFPDNPFMLIGWDKDADGEYPPYDADDTAVLDGNVGATFLGLAITNDPAEKSYVEIAHIAIKYYGYDTLGDSTPRGAMKMAPGNVSTVSHIYFHDVEMKSINDGIKTDGYTIIWSFWVGNTPFKHIALINNRIDGLSCYGCRGAPGNGSGFYRLQNNTYMFTVGEYKNEGKPNLGTVWKVWGEHSDVDFLDNLVYGATSDSATQTISGSAFGVRPCVRNYVIRNNEWIDARGGISVDGLSDGGCHARSIDNVVIDRNIIRNSYTNWNYGYLTPIMIDEGGTITAETVEDVTITNNFISILDTSQNTRGFQSHLGNDGGPQVGVITFAGNTVYGPGAGSLYRAMSIYSIQTYPQEDYVIKNNIFANVGANNRVTRVSHDPNGWIANGNIYDDDGSFNWDPDLGATLTFAEWQTASGQDANSKEGDPLFVNAANGDFHIHPNDTLVEGAGVDITSITTVDFDGDARSSSTPWPGADVGVEANVPNQAPTANDDSYQTDVNTELNVDANNGVLDNDSDPESDPLTAILVTDVSNGTLTLYSTGAFDYTPDANYVGEDMFVYKANDGELDSGDANVVITVSSTEPTDDYASAESTSRGTVDGNYTDTYSSDDSYEALTEVVHANRSKLEHEWTFSVTGGTSVQFSVEAYKAGTEDNFDFEYSPNGSDWTYMLTVSKTSDDNTPQTFDLPGGTSGTFYIHVFDTNRNNKAKDLDTVYVDHMFIRSQ